MEVPALLEFIDPNMNPTNDILELIVPKSPLEQYKEVYKYPIICCNYLWTSKIQVKQTIQPLQATDLVQHVAESLFFLKKYTLTMLQYISI